MTNKSSSEYEDEEVSSLSTSSLVPSSTTSPATIMSSMFAGGSGLQLRSSGDSETLEPPVPLELPLRPYVALLIAETTWSKKDLQNDDVAATPGSGGRWWSKSIKGGGKHLNMAEGGSGGGRADGGKIGGGGGGGYLEMEETSRLAGDDELFT